MQPPEPKLSRPPGNSPSPAPVPDPAFLAGSEPQGATAGVGWRSRVPAETEPVHTSGNTMDVRIETLAPIHVARIRHVGPYKEAGACFDRLFRWAAGLGVPTGRVLTLSWDNPDTVAPDKRRSDACVELRTAEEPPPGIVLGPVGGGRYAVQRLTGPYEGIAEAYRRLYEDWLPTSGETPADGPCMELYRHTPPDKSPEKLVTDLCVPLRTQKTAG